MASVVRTNLDVVHVGISPVISGGIAEGKVVGAVAVEYRGGELMVGIVIGTCEGYIRHEGAVGSEVGHQAGFQRECGVAVVIIGLCPETHHQRLSFSGQGAAGDKDGCASGNEAERMVTDMSAGGDRGVVDIYIFPCGIVISAIAVAADYVPARGSLMYLVTLEAGAEGQNDGSASSLGADGGQEGISAAD